MQNQLQVQLQSLQEQIGAEREEAEKAHELAKKAQAEAALKAAQAAAAGSDTKVSDQGPRNVRQYELLESLDLHPRLHYDVLILWGDNFDFPVVPYRNLLANVHFKNCGLVTKSWERKR